MPPSFRGGNKYPSWPSTERISSNSTSPIAWIRSRNAEGLRLFSATALLNSHMNAGMKQQPPAADQCIVGRSIQQFPRIRLGNEDKLIGKDPSGINAYFIRLDDIQQRLPIDNVALPMRHPKGKSRQAAILFNNPAKDPGRISRPSGSADRTARWSSTRVILSSLTSV